MKARFSWLVVCLIALAAFPALAGNKEEAKARFKEGRKAYQNGDYEKAVAAFEEAYQLDPSPAYLYNSAVAYEQWGKPEKAAEFYEKYLPYADPKEAPTIREKIKLLSGKDVSSTASPTPSEEAPETTIEIRSTPSGASVWLGEKTGDPAGKTPFSSPLTPGEHTIFVEKEGFLAISRTFTLKPGQTLALEFALEKANAPVLVSFQSSVEDVKVYIDDRSQGVAGTTPFQTMLAPGKHTIIAEKEGYEPLTKEITLATGEAGPVPVVLDLREGGYGWLQVTSNVRGTVVTVDGKKVGVAPFESDLPKIAVGKHQVSISCPGYVPWEGSINVTNGATIQIKTELAKKTRKTGALVALLISGGLTAGGVVLGQQAQNLFESIQSDIDAGLPVDDADPRFQEGFFRGLAADVSFGLAGVSFLVSITRFAVKREKSKGDVFTSVLSGASKGVSGVQISAY